MPRSSAARAARRQDDVGVKVLTLSTRDLEVAVYPEPLADVLCSLLFRRMIVRYRTNTEVTTVTVKRALSLSLEAVLLSLRGE